MVIINSKNDKISEKKIISFEEKFKVKIPEDYKYFLLKFNGGKTTPNSFTGDNSEECDLLSLNSMEEIEIYMNGDEDIIPNGFIPIGITDSNDWVFISTKRNSLGKIFLGNSNTYKDDNENDLIFIADNFNNFLNILYNSTL